MPRVIASIEARMKSSRLPGKILLDIAGAPALTRLVRRLRRCSHLDDIILATTVEAADNELEHWAKKEGVAFWRGSEEDVLQRVVDAHESIKSDIIVEITGDSILNDPEIIDWGIETFLANSCDVVTNVRPQTFPMGVDVQIFRAIDLAYVAKNIHDPAVREHVSLYFYEHPEKYRILSLLAPARWHAPQLRFQLDYQEDLNFLREIYRQLEPKYCDNFSVTEIMQLLYEQPLLVAINAHCEEKAVR